MIIVVNCGNVCLMMTTLEEHVVLLRGDDEGRSGRCPDGRGKTTDHRTTARGGWRRSLQLVDLELVVRLLGIGVPLARPASASAGPLDDVEHGLGDVAPDKGKGEGIRGQIAFKRFLGQILLVGVVTVGSRPVHVVLRVDIEDDRFDDDFVDALLFFGNVLRIGLTSLVDDAAFDGILLFFKGGSSGGGATCVCGSGRGSGGLAFGARHDI